MLSKTNNRKFKATKKYILGLLVIASFMIVQGCFDDLPDTFEEARAQIRLESDSFTSVEEFNAIDEIAKVKDLVKYVEVLKRYQKFAGANPKEKREVSIKDIHFYYNINDDGKFVRIDIPDTNKLTYSFDKFLKFQKDLLKAIKDIVNDEEN